MKNIIFYPSGHGFGHAVRQIEIMKEIFRENIEKNSDYNITVRTMAPEWLFNNSFSLYFENFYGKAGGAWKKHFKYEPFTNDVGTVQKDSLNMDIEATLKNCNAFYANFSERAKREAEHIKNCRADIVVGDIPPVAFEAAVIARIPAIGISNFSWDVIYKEFLDEYPGFRPVIDTIEKAYSKCGMLLRLPYPCPLPAFPNIRDVELIARKAYLSREAVYEKLGYDSAYFKGRKTVMISFGGFDTSGIRQRELEKLTDYRFLTTIRPESGHSLPHNVKYIDTEAAGISFENLFKIFDVIVTKPGYGVLGDIIAAKSSCIYADRGNFAEYPCLIKMLANHCKKAVYIEREKLLSCELASHIEEALEPNPGSSDMPTGGAAQCAEMICDL
ncbi:MAG TPA: hypothetical protein PKK26_13115 [Candidatus Wallbacteria bacterium]|nr:hypothetical protein [Candidatus Wallbacteria bacterium]